MNTFISVMGIIAALGLLIGMLMKPKNVERRAAMMLAASSIFLLIGLASGLWSERLQKEGASQNQNLIRLLTVKCFAGGLGAGMLITVLVLEKKKGG